MKVVYAKTEESDRCGREACTDAVDHYAADPTQTVQQPIVGFVLTNAGLMANLSLNGNRFTQIDL